MPRAPKSPNNVAHTFFNTVHLLPKDLSFQHGVAKLASCPGRRDARSLEIFSRTICFFVIIEILLHAWIEYFFDIVM